MAEWEMTEWEMAEWEMAEWEKTEWDIAKQEMSKLFVDSTKPNPTQLYLSTFNRALL